MKKTVALFGLLLAFGCAKETPIEKSISEYVQANLKDPASYERIEVKVLDTVTVGDEAKEESKFWKENIKKNEDKNAELMKMNQSEPVKRYIEDNNSRIENDKATLKTRCSDSLSTETRYYKVSHKYRANNSFGAKELYNDIVSMDKNYKITGSHAVIK